MQFMSSMSPSLSIFVNIGIVVVIWAGGLQAIRGDVYHRADRGLRQLPADHHGAADDHGHAGEHLGGRHGLGRAHQRSAGCRPRGAGCARRPGPAGQRPPRRWSLRTSASTTTAPATTPCCEDINLAAEPGQTVAILGATGAGKSTLVNLIPRFYDVSAGRVTDRRRRRAQRDAGLAPGAHRHRPAGDRACSPARCATTSATAARMPPMRK